MTPSESRAQRALQVATFLDRHRGPIMKVVAQVIHEMHGEYGPCQRAQQDINWAMEVSMRLDPVIELPEPFDTILDGVVFGVALAGVGIYRAAMRRNPIMQGAAPEHVASMIEKTSKAVVPRHLRAAQRMAVK